MCQLAPSNEDSTNSVPLLRDRDRGRRPLAVSADKARRRSCCCGQIDAAAARTISGRQLPSASRQQGAAEERSSALFPFLLLGLTPFTKCHSSSSLLLGWSRLPETDRRSVEQLETAAHSEGPQSRSGAISSRSQPVIRPVCSVSGIKPKRGLSGVRSGVKNNAS
ncbi:hypothetical protein EYF80_054899 [Liparis tanakae]|uniref:Uncharacterized protein n=1 Tax=Liparis tanakae TaxID=230148 RepID=A0A4Z2F1C2_9TELE|nr:hypothetical protein EYF80_054899 [Liparis tanakae]